MKRILFALAMMAIDNVSDSLKAAGKIKVARTLSEIAANVVKDALLTFFFGLAMIAALVTGGYYGIIFLRDISEEFLRYNSQLQNAAAAIFFLIISLGIYVFLSRRKPVNLISSRY